MSFDIFTGIEQARVLTLFEQGFAGVERARRTGLDKTAALDFAGYGHSFVFVNRVCVLRIDRCVIGFTTVC